MIAGIESYQTEAVLEIKDQTQMTEPQTRFMSFVARNATRHIDPPEEDPDETGRQAFNIPLGSVDVPANRFEVVRRIGGILGRTSDQLTFYLGGKQTMNVDHSVSGKQAGILDAHGIFSLTFGPEPVYRQESLFLKPSDHEFIGGLVSKLEDLIDTGQATPVDQQR